MSLIPRTVKTTPLTPEPYVVPPSKQWDRDDGFLSTFRIGVGSPFQHFRVLVGTSFSMVFIPGIDACKEKDGEKKQHQCALDRGAEPFQDKQSLGFNSLASTSWEGLAESKWTQAQNITATISPGMDIAGIGEGDTSYYSAIRQLVGLLKNDAYSMGQLGLSIRPDEVKSKPDRATPFLQSLRDGRKIPSLSYGYTAGAYDISKDHFASLTLGGYDKSRIVPRTHDVSFKIDPQKNSTLSIPLQEIQIDNFKIWGSGNAIETVIDSAFPFIQLPEDICNQFATKFGLQWIEAENVYLVNPAKREAYAKKVIKFQFGTGLGDMVNIEIPFKVFELVWTKDTPYPIAKNQSYFPLRKAPLNTQYVIGRTLLQTAYLVVDYERSNFSLYQAVQTDPLPEPEIVAISSVDLTITSTKPRHGSGKPLSTGVQAGMAVGVILAAMALAFGLYLWYKRHQRGKKSTKWRLPNEKHDSQELPGANMAEILGITKYELTGSQVMSKIPNHEVYEIDTNTEGYPAIFELGDGTMQKLPKSPVTQDKNSSVTATVHELLS